MPHHPSLLKGSGTQQRVRMSSELTSSEQILQRHTGGVELSQVDGSNTKCCARTSRIAIDDAKVSELCIATPIGEVGIGDVERQCVRDK